MNNADETTTTTTTCANCGKGGESSGDLKACTACKLVKYCNRECQIAHRPLHKKICKKRAAELHDEALFKEHPPPEDCPICLIPLPLDGRQMTFQSCCGKLICRGCMHAMAEEAFGRGKVGGELGLCAFCRALPAASEADEINRLRKLMKSENARAFHQLAGHYSRGDFGVQRDVTRANKLWLRAGELGCHEGYYNMGNAYRNGRGVEMDMKKAKYYYELAAMTGYLAARYNVGCMEGMAGNIDRAFKHYILSAKAGFKMSLNLVKKGFMDGVLTKDDYENTLRAHQERHDEMKSDERDRAAINDALQYA